MTEYDVAEFYIFQKWANRQNKQASFKEKL